MPTRLILACSCLVLITAATSTIAAAQPATMVYRLGTDTLAVEQFTRTGNHLTGEMVQRSGAAVVRVKYDMTLGTDGRPTAATVSRLQADGSPVANGPKEYRFRVTADSIVRETVFADSTQRRAFAATKALINFPVFAYGPTEVLAGLKKAGTIVDSLPALGLAGGLQYTGLFMARGDSVRLNGAPYAMMLRFDTKGQLQLVDGKFTTNKAYATRSNASVDIATLAKNMKATGVLSVRDMTRNSFGSGGMVVIDYGRPTVRERTVWGGLLIPYDSIWRTGANDATHMFITREMSIGDMKLPPAMYTLWVQHTRNGTFLIVNNQIGQWGTQYDASHDVGRVAMQMTPAPAAVEEFTITVKAMGPTRGALEMAWGPMVASVPFTVSGTRPQ